ncbi:MAG: T9SS type A sorting domain-containing protein [Chryseobacterium sp.]|nr:T9SS type A sorting domain-containing protein [Chryseobacterium sp.]MDN5424005.1 T9SS type A sorting domain-containing protein [Chryseobacterium sp.]MDN5476094.1 T9SS type A sorting domain-containing protein [Chryseobacterium sp.]
MLIAETMDNFYCAQSNWKLVMRKFDFKTSSSLSTHESNTIKDFNIYPNPADYEVFLEGLDKNIELISIDGKKMEARVKMKDEKLILDVSHLLKGTYIIKGKNRDGKIVTEKFIKK